MAIVVMKNNSCAGRASSKENSALILMRVVSIC